MTFENIIAGLCPPVVLTAFDAGQKILEIYGQEDFEVQIKEDKSPLTAADRAANALIMQRLQALWDLPVISEEAKEIPYETRSQWTTFWLVDPLDGTKEFIKRNGEFTVNIALIHQGKPVFGVVFAPVPGTLYVGATGQGTYKAILNTHFASRDDLADKLHNPETSFQRLPLPKNKDGRTETRIVASRSHCNVETQDYIDRLQETRGPVKLVSIGSSLKLCLLAEGSADVYPRLAPTMNWDIGAAQAILEATGGKLLTWVEHEPISYNQPSLVNPFFVAYAHDWE